MMNVIHFNEKACERIRRYFDAYLDNELLVETTHEVSRHLSVCLECIKILNDRARLKRDLKRVVDQETAPAMLLESIQTAIRGRKRFFDLDVRRWVLVVASIVVLATGGIIALRSTNVFAPLVTASRDSFELISAQAQELMRVGLVDHVYCALVVGKWREFLSLEHMKQETGREALGPEFIDLVPLVTEKVGPNLHVVQGHRCVANHRQYVHIILTGDKGVILSLVITKKSGEALDHANIVATLQASGVPVYSANQGQLEIAAFETSRYLAYVVSNLDRDNNLKVASKLAVPVHQYLSRLGA
jgi:Putative zinc-finger